MQSHYLFVHFRETTSPEGEQVYFALSRDGFHWEALNEGLPILWAYYGDHGVRDMTIVRERESGRVHIFATDLSLSYGMRGKYAHSWDRICEIGSKCLAHWVSDDLLHWSEEELIPLGTEEFGCVWAPDVIYDPEEKNYVLHWSSAVRLDDGRWCLFLDYYGVAGKGQGYVPFVSDSLKSGDFVRSDAAFSFPYGFKHGTILRISEEEYSKMKAHDWTDVPDRR